MEIVSLLRETPVANKNFSVYYSELFRGNKTNGISLSSFLSYRFDMQLGVWLDFLSTCGLSVHASPVGYVIYTLNKDESWGRFGFEADSTGYYIVDCETWDEPITILDCFGRGVLRCMVYLNDPANFVKDKPPF